MGSNTLALKNSAGMGMYEFFYEEFKTLRAKTGIRQWEQLNEQAGAAKVIHDVIGFMIEECNKPPFDIVSPDVKQRVISRAVVEDQDFIGLNAKFVRKALNTWWLANGDRVLEVRNAKDESVYRKVELTPEQNEYVNGMLESYKRMLLSGEGFKPVPKIRPEDIEVEGAERRRATPYPVTSLSEARKHEMHLEYIRRNYDKYTADKLPHWKPEQEWIDGLTDDEKEKIYNQVH